MAQYSIVNRTEKYVNLWLNRMKILIYTDEHLLYAITHTTNNRTNRARTNGALRAIIAIYVCAGYRVSDRAYRFGDAMLTRQMKFL